MGVGYSPFNATKMEQISFSHVAASKAREIAGNPAAAAIVSWYCIQNAGDRIAFVSDTYGDWPFARVAQEAALRWPDVTDRVVDELIAAEILADHGRLHEDPEEPDTVYTRDLRNVWMT